MTSSQMQFEGLLLTGAADDTFADFYRAHVRYSKGARLPASQLTAAYVAWADERSIVSSSAPAIRKFMEANGHAHRKSSAVYYLDAVLGDFEGAPLPARSVPVADARPIREAVSVTVDDLDQIIAELQVMRRRLARIMPTPKGRGA